MNGFSSPASPVARPSGLAPAWLVKAATALFAALRASSQARARAELLASAERCQSLQPQLAAELRAAGDRLVGR